MEEMLIKNVRANSVLYDPNNLDYRNHQLRKSTWDEVGENLGIPGSECKEAWNKLRNAYVQAVHRRAQKPGHVAKNLPKWKFADQMAFLNRTIVKKTGPEDSYDIEYDDTIEEKYSISVLEEIDSKNVLSECSESNLSRREDFPTTLAQSHAEHVKKRLSSPAHELVPTMAENPLARSQKKVQSASSNNVTDECELFFLSMSKYVKKLRPDEQIKVQMEVSNIVLGASLKAVHESSFS